MKARQPHSSRPKTPRGFPDRSASALECEQMICEQVMTTYRAFGYRTIDTPIVERRRCLGNHLPDTDRPDGGVYGVQADDEDDALALRYDLTAPLARYVAQHQPSLRFPFKSSRAGPIFRNEKPAPGRFRQFEQADADIVGISDEIADAEMCILASNVLDRLLPPHLRSTIAIGHRGLLDGLFERAGVDWAEDSAARLTAMRAVDKYDRLGEAGVADLLGSGRKDESGDFTPGAGLPSDVVAHVVKELARARTEAGEGRHMLRQWKDRMRGSETGERAAESLMRLIETAALAGVPDQRLRVSAITVRGLGYYTGPVFEVGVSPAVEDGESSRAPTPAPLGSVAGGGRYDNLIVDRTGSPIPATGLSFGISRLAALLGSDLMSGKNRAPVVVTIMDRDALDRYLQLANSLRNGGIATDLYLAPAGLKAQLRYADQIGSPCAIIQGSEERARRTVMVKDLNLGRALARSVSSHEQWTAQRTAQTEVAEDMLVGYVRSLCDERTVPPQNA